MALAIGIVGLPNVGKSTLFNALLGASQAAAANYPFCTIEPNLGIVPVPDKRLEALSALFGPEKTTPTTLEFVDIAGLVAGASKGEGLGNQFLANIREVDAIAHVLRCFEDPDVIHVANKVDPKSDRDVVETELMLKDLDGLEKRRERTVKNTKSQGKAGAQAEADRRGARGDPRALVPHGEAGALHRQRRRVAARQGVDRPQHPRGEGPRRRRGGADGRDLRQGGERARRPRAR